jgi:hypothetical protein
MKERAPFVFIHPKSNQTSIVCFCQKAGSMAWSSLFAKTRAVSLTRWDRKSTFIEFPSPYLSLNHSERFLRQHARALLHDPAVPRVRFVRNPYARLLSGYLSRVALNANSTGIEQWWANRVAPAHYGYRRGDTFEGFASVLTSYEPRHNAVEDHFKLQHDACRLPGDASWDYELKVEEIDEWYAPLIRLLGIAEDEVCSGWQFKQGQACFHRYRAPSLAAACPVVADHRMHRLAAHNKGADGLLAAHMRNRSLATKITEWVRRDLQRFGYPEWDMAAGRAMGA